MQTKNRHQRRRRADTGLKVCFVTRNTAPREEMLRFVISPDGVVVFDADGKLPGAGIWLTADQSIVRKAVDKKLFCKVTDASVQIPADLADQVTSALKQKCLSLLGFARKAGILVFGYEGVKKIIGTGEAVLAFEASDAAENGKNKLYHPSDEIHIFEFLSRTELGQITGSEAQVHTAVLRSPFTQTLLATALKLDLYLNGRKDQ